MSKLFLPVMAIGANEGKAVMEVDRQSNIMSKHLRNRRGEHGGDGLSDVNKKDERKPFKVAPPISLPQKGDKDGKTVMKDKELDPCKGAPREEQ